MVEGGAAAGPQLAGKCSLALKVRPTGLAGPKGGDAGADRAAEEGRHGGRG